MYLSRIQLNRHRRDAWRLLSSPQRMHAAVLSSFLDPPTGARSGASRVLWRLDAENAGRTFLYVVSPDRPDFAHLAEQAGWPSLDRGASKDYQAFLSAVTTGQRWAFRLTANPTRYHRSGEGQRARRVAHVTAEYQEAWLLERAEACGFRLVGADTAGSRALAVTRRDVRQFERRGSAKPVTIAVAQFDGVLDVIDADALRSALTTGVGPAKAYGCGLLTLAPLH
ncbi:type I-E CRISPR-associated protein Cas6/Cse3/CasE [Cellulomonas uda]|uniref:Type I-E CRISPR-associated protein Cas6/Cse3/CasE n=1 Tax=Cellulomonas uda TaxID=1714 RepID=A0A4Y3KCM5_CELUD|nr:type I-E CRISPR-associated protein Cas6/Cse3/CasE [Cellulomonas uda]NII65228.1 CRISPR system Cascade subunit CasE [Cellulomonas uda]GEA81733.1 type I-E CRISPR-associated protein Cas6/Cse3/CasE [Cellulomonas uda]